MIKKVAIISKVPRIEFLSKAELNRLGHEVKVAFKEASLNHYSSYNHYMKKIDKIVHKWRFEHQDNQISFDDFTIANFPNDLSDYEAVITFGGDGTVLAASHATQHQPIFAFVTDEKSAGYLCSGNEANYIAFEKWLKSDLKYFDTTLNPRLALYVDGVFKIAFLNDILFTNSHPAEMSVYTLTDHTGDEDIEETQHSSGIWVSTAMGKTGAIRSAGHPFWKNKNTYDNLHNTLLYKVREPYTGRGPVHHTEGTLRCAVDDDGCEEWLSLTPMRKGMCCYADGAYNAVPVGLGQTITIKPYEYPLHLVGAKSAL